MPKRFQKSSTNAHDKICVEVCFYKNIAVGQSMWVSKVSDNRAYRKTRRRGRDWNTEVGIPMSQRNNKVVEIPKSAVTPRGFCIAEAAAYMGVSSWFVEQEIRAGRLPALKLCRDYTLLKEDLDAYLDDAKDKAA